MKVERMDEDILGPVVRIKLRTRRPASVVPIGK